jgi:hypothetical protein
MSISRTRPVILITALLLSSCSYLGQGSKTPPDPDAPVAKGNVPDPPLPGKTDPGIDPGLDPGLDPDLPVVPTPGKPANPKNSKVSFDPFGKTDPGKTKAAFDLPKLPSATELGEPEERVLTTLPIPKAGAVEPAPKPQVVTLTWIGGKDKQWIQDVGFAPDGKIFARGGGDTFTVWYSADGVRHLKTEGDINKPCTGLHGPNLNTWGSNAFRATCSSTKITLQIGTHYYSRTQLQPYLHSTADWKWWGWEAASMGKGLDQSGRGICLYGLHDERFLAKVFVDGGKTTVAKDPRDLKKDNPALVTAMMSDPAGAGTLYMIGHIKNGAPEVGTFLKGRSLAEAIDPWQRVYAAVPYESKGTPDGLKLGGTSGICILNSTLTGCLFSGTMGADHIYSMAIKDNLLVVGGNIGVPYELDPKVKAKNLHPAKLPVRNPAQPQPGGDEDGFLAIIKLW